MSFPSSLGRRPILNNMDEHLLRFNKDKTYVFIDCETLNLCLNFCQNLPWQISMLKVKGNHIIDERDYYIKWNTNLKISEEAARLTRYSQTRMDKDGLAPEEVFPTIHEWLRDCDYIVGHNILGFDLYLLKGFYEYMREDYNQLTPKIIDTNCIARGVKYGMIYKKDEDFTCYQYKVLHTRKKGVKSSLSFLGKEFEIEHDYENLHDAIVDLKLNLKVWNKLKWQIEI